MKRDPTAIIAPDGYVYARGDLTSHIEYVSVPWDGRVHGQLDKDERALITSILAPHHAVRNLDLGEIRFTYNSRTMLSAPLVALRNRYHRLMHLQALRERFKILIDPNTQMPSDWGEEDLRPLIIPIHMLEMLPYTIEHDAPEHVRDIPQDDLVIEFQYLFHKGWHNTRGPALWRPR